MRKGWTAKAVMWLAWLAALTAAWAQSLQCGDRVGVTYAGDYANIRASACGSVIGQIRAGNEGQIASLILLPNLLHWRHLVYLLECKTTWLDCSRYEHPTLACTDAREWLLPRCECSRCLSGAGV
jgi:hypothetical protein